MSEQDDTERRAYAKGYNAGKRRLSAEMSRESLARQKEAFRQAVFLHSIGPMLEGPAWTQGQKTLNTLTDRVRLAWDAADEAVKRAAFYPEIPHD